LPGSSTEPALRSSVLPLIHLIETLTNLIELAVRTPQIGNRLYVSHAR
jgi:hypothetical protein